MTWAAVIGSPISHSLSPVLHRAAWDSLGIGGDWDYRAIETTTQTLGSLVSALGSDCLGLSVTMPCKQAVIPLLDVLDPLAQAVGAVNTVLPGAGVLTGANTDVHGIVAAVNAARAARDLPAPASCVILGARATASSALAACGHLHVGHVSVAARHFGGPGSVLVAGARLGVSFDQVFLRNRGEVLQAIRDADLIVSTLPVGVGDDLAVDLSPRPDQTLLDVVYAPRLTALTGTWQQAGGSVAWGSDMLLHQAAEQVRLMTGRDPDTAVMRIALHRALGIA